MNATGPRSYFLPLDSEHVSQPLEATISLSEGLNEIIEVKPATECPVPASPQERYVHMKEIQECL